MYTGPHLLNTAGDGEDIWIQLISSPPLLLSPKPLDFPLRSINANPSGNIFNRITQNLAYGYDVTVIINSKTFGISEKLEKAIIELGFVLNKDKMKEKYIRISKSQSKVEEQLTHS